MALQRIFYPNKYKLQTKLVFPLPKVEVVGELPLLVRVLVHQGCHLFRYQTNQKNGD